MAYIPQFVPTNIEALQGTLNQYQQASDLETTRQNQVNDTYSALPTTRTYDTAMKNQTMDQFSKVREDLDKKYNYDRSNSQYAKDLAREITKLRGNPLWAHIQQKDEVDKMRKELIANKGADYYENFNPNDLTLENAKKIQEWKPMDLKDMERQVASLAKEHSTSMRQQKLNRPTPGILEFVNQEGFPDIESATSWLSTEPGQAWLEQSVMGTGFEGHLSDPLVKGRAIGAALGQLVGKPDIQRMGDPAWEETQIRARAAEKVTETMPWGKVTNTPITTPYTTKSLSDYKATKTELDGINKKLNDPNTSADERIALQQKQSELQLDSDRVSDVVSGITTSPEGLRIKATGESLIKKYFPTISKQNAEKLNNTIIDAQVNVGDLRKNPIGEVLNDVVNGIATGALSISKLFNRRDAEKTASINKKLDEIESQSDSYDIIYKLAGGVYKEARDKGLGVIAAERKSMRFINDLNDFYKGRGNFVNNGFNQIENKIDAKLSSGETQVADVYAAPIDISAGELKKIPTFLTSNLTAFDVVQEGGNKQLTDKEVEKISSLFDTKEGADKAGTSVQIAINRETEPILILKAPTGERIKLKMNIAKMSTDVAEQLVQMTGLPQIMDVLYKDINFANKTYTLDDNYLKNIISQRYRSSTPFQGISITKDEDPQEGIMYSVTLPKFKEIFGSESVVFKSKHGMIRTLDEIYNDYITNKK